MDVESIDSGQFDTIILRQIAARMHFILVLQPGSLDRIGEPGDWLAREIREAMTVSSALIFWIAYGVLLLWEIGGYVRGVYDGWT
jgi:hypothetical protein